MGQGVLQGVRLCLLVSLLAQMCRMVRGLLRLDTLMNPSIVPVSVLLNIFLARPLLQMELGSLTPSILTTETRTICPPDPITQLDVLARLLVLVFPEDQQ